METERLTPSGKIKQEPDWEDLVVNFEANGEEENQWSDVVEKNMSSFTSLSCPEEDSFLYCGKCQLKYEGGCPDHGPHIYMDNAEADQGEDCSLEFSPQVQTAGSKSRQVSGMTKAVCEAHSDSLETLPNGGCIPSESDEMSSLCEVNSEICLAGTSWETQYNNGEITDNLRKPSICDVCGAGFTHNGLLIAHRSAHTGEKPYKCDMCGVGFSQSVHLTTHKRIHTGEKPFICNLCGVGFAQSGHLITHKRIHTGEKPYKCEMCDDRFAQSGGLKIHMKTHTREKTHKCDVCGVGFARGGDLIQHKRTHTGEKPYMCDVCGVGFSQGGGLTRHYRIHTGEKPYKCDVCGVECVRCGDLVRHKKTHTGEKPYKCDMCGAGFSESGGLTRHKRIHK